MSSLFMATVKVRGSPRNRRSTCPGTEFELQTVPPLKPRREANDDLQQFTAASIDPTKYIRDSKDIFTMSDDEDGPPMLVSSEGVDDAEASLNAEMADAQVKKVPISIITGE